MRFRMVAPILTVGLLGCLTGCGAAPRAGAVSPSTAISVTASPTRTESPSPSALVSPSPPASPLPSGSRRGVNETLTPCELLTGQRFQSAEYGFILACPPGYWWGTFDNPAPGWLALYRVVETRYLDVYPAGQMEIGVRTFDSDTLRDWINQHVGARLSTDPNHIWDSVSNLQAVAVGSAAAIKFDYVFDGPESPVNFHAVAVVLQSKFVLVIDWWAYPNSGYSATIDSVADALVASVTIS
jgi:hypothetical protein